jgi:hypothetical protein
MDVDLDTDPRVVRAGRDARDVYLFVCRRHYHSGSQGFVSARDVDPTYLARSLFITPAEASDGLAGALREELLVIDRNDGDRYVTLPYEDDVTRVTPSDRVRIVDFTVNEEARPRNGAERQQTWRDRQKAAKIARNSRPRRDSNVTVTEPNVTSDTVTSRDASEESREEERRGDLSLVPGAPGTPASVKASRASAKASRAEAIQDTAWVAADTLRKLVLRDQPSNQLARKPWSEEKTGTRLEWADEFRLLFDVDKRSPEELGLLLRWVFNGQTADAKFEVESPKAVRKKWDRITKQMARERERKGPRPADPRVGRIEPSAPETYANGDQPI